MNRKIALRIIIILIILFFSVIIYSTLTTKDPLEREFYGVVSDIWRMYPSKVVIELENQSEKYYMTNELEKFKNSVEIGDSIAKPFNNKFIFIYKLNDNNKFATSSKFLYE